MHLESRVVISRTPEQVWSFLGDISNLAKWDRGVAEVRQTSSGPMEVGSTFDTLAYPRKSKDRQERGRMSYRLIEVEPDHHFAVALIDSTGNARFFKKAQWRMMVEHATEGAQVSCSVDFALRFRYFILAPILYAMRRAILIDLGHLKRKLEA